MTFAAFGSAERVPAWAAGACVVLALVCAGEARAEAARPLTSVDPTAIVPKAPSPSTPLELMPPRTPSSEDRAPRFVLIDAAFDGVTALPVAALEAAWSDYKGKTISIADLSAIALRAEAIYAERGYPFVAVVVTPQRVNDGRVRFKVVEGRISDLKVLGGDQVARRQAAAYFTPLINRQPLSAAALEGAYVRAKAVPGIAIAGSLRRGGVAGGMDLVLQARRKAWTTYVNINNFYPDAVGPWGVLVGADHAGGSRYGDETAVQVYRSVRGGDQTVVRASHQRTLNAAGTTVSVMALGGWAHPAGALESLDLATKVYAGRLSVSQPLLSRVGATVAATAGFDFNNQTTKVFSTVGLAEDRLRIVSASIAGELRGGDNAHFGVQMEARKGLTVLDATRSVDPLDSHVGADPQALVGKVSMEGESARFHRIRFAGRLEGQIANGPLTTPDQYQIGDLTLGRGYEPGAAVGDDALGGSAEVRIGPYRGPHNLTFQPYVFADVVRLWSLTPGAESVRTLSSAGGGVRIEARGRMTVDLAYAKARTPPLGLGEPTPAGRFLVNVTVGLNDVFSAIHHRLVHGARA